MLFKSFGPWEIGLILIIILIVFGVGRLPQVGSAMGKALRSFRSAKQGEDEEEEKKAKPQEEKKTEKSPDKSQDKS